MDGIVFTPAAVLELLTSIDELSHLNVSITETIDGDIQIQIGDSNYALSTDNASVVQVDESTIDSVSEINQDAYENMEASGTVSLSEPVSSGILKELAKSLLLGGMIKLSAKLLRN